MSGMRAGKEDITVSVVLATYNRARFLPQALDSLLGQTRLPDEIIVINDNSTDDTGAVLRGHAHPVRSITRQTNAGQPAALNQGIRAAQGSHIWLFDDDDIALPDALENHVNFLRARPDLDFSYSDKFTFDGDGNIRDRKRWRLDRLDDLPPELFLIRTMEIMNTMLPGMLIPARCYQTVGLFDESLQRCLDHELLLRLARRFRGGNMGHPSFVYRNHDGVRGPAAEAHAAGERFLVMHRYRQKIFRRVRTEFPLECYLPATGEARPIEGELLAQALLQRACVMLRHGLVDEGLADLKQGLEQLAKSSMQPDWLPRILSRSFDVEPWVLSDRRRLLTSVTRIMRDCGALQLARYPARGLYWNGTRAWKSGKWHQSLQSVMMLLALTTHWAACRASRG